MEVGCGTAKTLNYLKKNTRSLSGYGVDLSQIAIDIAKGKTDSFHFFKADAAHLPFKEKFDLVYSVGLIEHFERDKAKEILRQKISTIVEGGYLSAVVPAKYGLLYLYEKCMGEKWPFETEIPFTKNELKNSLMDIGLKDTKVYYINFMTLLGIGKK